MTHHNKLFLTLIPDCGLFGRSGASGKTKTHKNPGKGGFPSHERYYLTVIILLAYMVIKYFCIELFLIARTNRRFPPFTQNMDCRKFSWNNILSVFFCNPVVREFPPLLRFPKEI